MEKKEREWRKNEIKSEIATTKERQTGTDTEDGIKMALDRTQVNSSPAPRDRLTRHTCHETEIPPDKRKSVISHLFAGA